MNTAVSNLEKQKAYVESLIKKKFKFGLTVGEAFVRSIRDLGYKHSGTALDELVDNSMQAGAANVHVVFGFEGAKSKANPSEIAIIDDGHGMVPDMIRLGMTWGGTHREDDRTGFGRYGYSLPSACVSTGRRYTVYSKPKDATLYSVTVDIDDLCDGKYTNDAGDIIVPVAVKAKLPKFVEDHIGKHFPGKAWTGGTIVVIEKPDKLTWKSANGLQDNLLTHFGVTYHKLRADLDVWVNDTRVDPIDPLFTTPGYRWYDSDGARAQALDPIVIEARDPDTKEVKGYINARISYLPPTFASIDKEKDAVRGNQNPRFRIIKDYNGFIFARMGRVIDVVKGNELTTFQNYDRYIKIEIDFPAALDEMFNVTTAKQQIVPKAGVWDMLKQNGLDQAVKSLRSKFKEELRTHRATREISKEKKRASEEAMERTKELAPKPSNEAEARTAERGEKGLQQAAERVARETGKPISEVRKELEFALKGRPYKVAYESVPSAPFFRADMWGGTKMLFLNTASRFYQDVYAHPNGTPEVRAAVEVLLFAIADRMLDSTDHLRDIYNHEVQEWSRKLEYALGQLAQGVGLSEDNHPDNDGEALQAAE